MKRADDAWAVTGTGQQAWLKAACALALAVSLCACRLATSVVAGSDTSPEASALPDGDDATAPTDHRPGDAPPPTGADDDPQAEPHADDPVAPASQDPVSVAPDVSASDRQTWLQARTEPRGYAHDPRWPALASLWPRYVERAVARLPVVTGLTFAKGPPPRVVLTPLGDETLPFALRVDVIDGRRRAGILVNAEPLVAGIAPVDRTVLHALGAAVLEDSRSRRGDVPAWVSALAGLAASGDLQEHLTRLHRDWLLGDRDALAVDPEDDDTALATALGAMVLLSERATPYDVRRFLRAVAGGDDPNESMARLVGESGTGWTDAARLALHGRIRKQDASPWERLQAAEEALEQSGRVGFEASIRPPLPPDIVDEIRVLRARAALDEGDGTTARTELRALSGHAFRTLRDPARAVLLRVEAEMTEGGDTDLARRFARQHELDFPSHPAGPRIRELASQRGMQEDPQAWMRAMRARIDREGTGALDLKTSHRYLRALLLDHRAGAAEQALLALGARGHALELHNVARAIADAQEDPTRAAKARASDRIRVWLRTPTQDAVRDVVDGGVASAAVLAEMMRATPDASAQERTRVVDLLARAAGPTRVLRILRTVWQTNNAPMLGDLAQLARHVSVDALEVAIFESDIAVIAGHPSDVVWDRVALGLPRAWLREHPAFLQRLRDPAFSTRERALSAMARDTTVAPPPALLGHVLRDESPVLRRQAVELAGRHGYQALVELGLNDDHARVRRSACRALARTAGRAAVPRLLDRMRTDEDPEVRSVAAWALLEIAPDDPGVLDALLATQRHEDPRLREPLEQALPQVPPEHLAPALARAIGTELRRRPPSRAALFRWMAIYQRASRTDVGYTPQSTRQEIRAMVDRISAWGRQPAADR